MSTRFTVTAHAPEYEAKAAEVEEYLNILFAKHNQELRAAYGAKLAAELMTGKDSERSLAARAAYRATLEKILAEGTGG